MFAGIEKRNRVSYKPVGATSRSPKKSKSKKFLSESIWSKWRSFFIGLGLFILLWLAAITITYSILFGRDDARYHRIRNDIDEIRDAVGFFATKRGNQNVPANVFTTISSWSTASGDPFYDNSYGAMDFTSGIWTSQMDGKYVVSASICWTSSGTLNTREMRFLTNGTSSYYPFMATIGYGQVCSPLTATMDVPRGVSVQVQALRTSAGSEVVETVLTTFGIERVAYT